MTLLEEVDLIRRCARKMVSDAQECGDHEDDLIPVIADLLISLVKRTEEVMAALPRTSREHPVDMGSIVPGWHDAVRVARAYLAEKGVTHGV